jgi:lipopolysaccharide transport system ATP-binding protein
MPTAIEFNNISKLYRLGVVTSGTLGNDLKRWWQMNILGREDPFLKVGSVNDRSKAADSEYVWALKDIDFKVDKGDVVGIIGKNGAGKSTLLKLLSKVTAPTTGSIKAKGRIASLLEVGTGFHSEMTGRENIYMNGAILGMSKQEINRKLDEIIDFSGCERYIDTPVKRYSSGMTVRLGFAVAAHLDPDILVVDEVLAVGDAEFQKKAIGKMQDVSKGEGRTVLFVSHNMASLKALCRRGILLENGSVRYDGSMPEAISLYLRDNDVVEEGDILSALKKSSPDIKLTKVLVNGKTAKSVNLMYPERELTVGVEGDVLRNVPLAIECRIFDREHVLLAKFAPALMNEELKKTPAGPFELKETIRLPKNMTNGEFRMDIDITHPGVQYLATIPDAVRLSLTGYISPSGNNMVYAENGLLYLE